MSRFKSNAHLNDPLTIVHENRPHVAASHAIIRCTDADAHPVRLGGRLQAKVNQLRIGIVDGGGQVHLLLV